MANDARNIRSRPFHKPVRSFVLMSSQATTGAGTGYGIGHGFTVFSIQAVRASATTVAGHGSTKVSYRLQGSIDNSAWFTIGAATRAITSTSPTLGAVTSTAGIAFVRASINSFSTVASTSASDGGAATVKILPIS